MSGIEAAFFGALARDAEQKTSKAGKLYLRFTARIGDGDAAQWVSVLAFDERALEAADKFTKGARVYVEGRLSIDEWVGQDGAKRSGLTIMSFHCRLAAIGRNRVKSSDTPKSQGTNRSANAAAADPDLDDPLPF
jgi:single-stranded DNA-binding protein